MQPANKANPTSAGTRYFTPFPDPVLRFLGIARVPDQTLVLTLMSSSINTDAPLLPSVYSV